MEDPFIVVTRGEDSLLRCTPCDEEIEYTDMVMLIKVDNPLVYNPVCPKCSLDIMRAAEAFFNRLLAKSPTF